MIKRLEIYLKRSVCLLDILTIALSFVVTYHVRTNIHLFYHWNILPDSRVFEKMLSFEYYFWLLLIILPAWIGNLHVFGAYRELRVRSVARTLWILFITNVLGHIFLASAVFIIKLEYFSRSFLGFFFVINFTALAAQRILLIWSWRHLASNDFFKKNILIVGTGPRAKSTIRMIRQHPEWGLRMVGVLDTDQHLVGQMIEGVKVTDVLDNLEDYLRKHVVDEVLFVVPRGWMDRIEESVLACEHVGVRATVAVDLFNIKFAKSIPSDMEGTPMITFDATPIDHWKLALKHIGDVTAAAVCLAISSPLLVAAAVLVKVTSPGPVFFSQVRCGLNGRKFKIYKFRSMEVNAEQRQSELLHLNELGGPVFKVTNDPRLTAIGKFLRKTSIDELPQLFNVLCGDMSLVGPRPPIPKEVDQYQTWQRRRLSMRPGITGNWQVNGRNHVKDFDTWMRLDLDYIDRWSLGLDMQILLKTIPTVLSGSGAK